MMILCLDFDGVIHSYSSGWQGATVISDPPVDGALAFMSLALSEGFDVHIFSSRSHQEGGIKAMKNWLRHHAGAMWNDAPGFPGLENIQFPEYKPSAFVTIDDRALTFDGTFPSLDVIRNFKPWNKRNDKAKPPKTP